MTRFEPTRRCGKTSYATASTTSEVTMTMSKRIQLRRSKGWRKPEGAVVVSRPSRWGNPIRVGEPYQFHVHGYGWAIGVARTRADAVEAFRLYLSGDPEVRQMIRDELAGKDLACWCPLDGPCHADVLLEIANGDGDA